MNVKHVMLSFIYAHMFNLHASTLCLLFDCNTDTHKKYITFLWSWLKLKMLAKFSDCLYIYIRNIRYCSWIDKSSVIDWHITICANQMIFQLRYQVNVKHAWPSLLMQISMWFKTNINDRIIRAFLLNDSIQ